MAWLAASHVSPSASQVRVSELMILDICGPTLAALWFSPILIGSSSKTSPAICKPEHLKSAATCKAWVSRLRSASTARRKSVRRIAVSASSSSADETRRWPTAAASDGEQVRRYARGNPSLGLAAQQWATPTAKEIGGNPEAYELRSARMEAAGGRPLGKLLLYQVQQWMTPRTMDARGGQWTSDPTAPSGRRQVLPGQALSWPTPTVSSSEQTGGEKEREGRLGAPTLSAAVASWATPQAHDAKTGKSTEAVAAGRARSGAGVQNLCEQAPAWAPPAPVWAASAPSRPAPPTLTAGASTSSTTRTLNPQFVEALMGWPYGWSVFACSETE